MIYNCFKPLSEYIRYVYGDIADGYLEQKGGLQYTFVVVMVV